MNEHRLVSRRLRALASHLLVAIIAIPTLLLGSSAVAGPNPSGKPFRSLDERVTQLEEDAGEVRAVVPILSEGIRAALTFSPPEELTVKPGSGCPEGYRKLSDGFVTYDICVLDDQPPPPEPAPKVCEEGYVLNETLPDGSTIPAHLIVCERIAAGSATVYVTHREIRSEFVSLTAECPESFIVTGGGYSSIDALTGAVSTDLFVYSSRPNSPRQWSISGKFPNNGLHEVTAFALCAIEPAT